MRRGFKADAERIAARVRKGLGLRPGDALVADDLAAYLGASVRSADELVSAEKLQTLNGLQEGAFSACTFIVGDRRVVVFNPIASPGRRQSDIAHEMAHVLLEHDLKSVERLGSLTFFTCDPDEEQEANWLAGCLLLPRSLLLAAARKGMDGAAIAEAYGVSRQMADYRLRATGVQRQLAAGRARKSSAQG